MSLVVSSKQQQQAVECNNNNVNNDNDNDNPWWTSTAAAGKDEGIGHFENAIGGRRSQPSRKLAGTKEEGMGEEFSMGQKGGGERPPAAESWAEMLRAWPKTTFCIVSNEFCERFSYYGMRTVLTLYLLNVLKYDRNMATMLFNGFTVLCYLTPLFGSILADGYIGKFRTIFLVSIFYTSGQIVLALAASQDSSSPFHPWLDIMGLVIIGFGTGGIKPCVCSFGGDQFEPHQEKMLSLFFSAFYFSINAGSMISTFISPMFRASPCLGQDSCYPMAFGIPALLMVVATLVFISGSFWYKKPPPKENIFGEVYRTSKVAVRNRWRSESASGHGHWLDYFFDTHSCAFDPSCREAKRRTKDPRACHKRQFIADLKGLLRLLVMYLPAPMFWALYDQQGSRWLIQSLMMDCRLWGDTLLLPDQMQTLNAVLILLYIPLFQAIVYPLVSICFKLTPLRKMVAGGLIAALAFVVSAGVQYEVNKTLPATPLPGHAFMSAINGFPAGCPLTVCSLSAPGDCRRLDSNQTLAMAPMRSNPSQTNATQRGPFQLPAGPQSWQIQFEGDQQRHKSCAHLWGPTWRTGNFTMESGRTYWMLVTRNGVLFGEADTAKPTEGTGEFSLGISLATDTQYDGNLALCRTQKSPTAYPCDPRKAEDFYAWQTGDSSLMVYEDGLGRVVSSAPLATLYKFKSIRPGDWTLYRMKESPKKVGQQTMAKEELHVNRTGVQLSIRAQGGVYLLALSDQFENPERRLLQVVPDNSVSILWQVPQIAIITAAEILFSITGYEFAYSQAAPSMKSLVQALWLLTTALGDTIIVVITLINFPDMAVEFLFYAAAMVVVTVVLALLAIFYYEYKFYTGESESEHSSLDWPAAGESNANEREEEKEEWSPIGGKRGAQPGLVQMYGSNEDNGEHMIGGGREKGGTFRRAAGQ